MAWQDAPRPPVTDELAQRCRQALHVITPAGETLAAGRASLCVLGLLGYPRLARLAGLPPFIWAVEAGYWLVARNRRWLSRVLYGKSQPRQY